MLDKATGQHPLVLPPGVPLYANLGQLGAPNLSESLEYGIIVKRLSLPGR